MPNIEWQIEYGWDFFVYRMTPVEKFSSIILFVKLLI